MLVDVPNNPKIYRVVYLEEEKKMVWVTYMGKLYECTVHALYFAEKHYFLDKGIDGE
jgi:hypothetical protein